jgi:hypothetical protein
MVRNYKINVSYESAARFWFRTCVLMVCIFNFQYGNSQVVKSVVLDSVVVEEAKRGFNVADFIELVKNDTSFINSFRLLRNIPHGIHGVIRLFNKKGKEEGRLIRYGEQRCEKGVRWIEIKDEKIEGRFYNRKKESMWYTTGLFDEIFFYRDTAELSGMNSISVASKNSEQSNNIARLKTLIFSPGKPVGGVPFIGNRTAIFDDRMTDHYDYRIDSKYFHDSVSCYVFSCRVKNEYDSYPVIRYLNTWFDKKTFHIVYRDYHMKYSGVLFDLDVKMSVTTIPYKNRRLLSSITYSGFWDLPLKKEERMNFELRFNPVPPE